MTKDHSAHAFGSKIMTKCLDTAQLSVPKTMFFGM